MEKQVTVLENGEALDISESRAQKLESKGIIYRCPDPECCGMFHIFTPEYGWADVEEFKE